MDHHSVSDFDPARITRTWSSNLGQMEICRFEFIVLVVYRFLAFEILVLLLTSIFSWWFAAKIKEVTLSKTELELLTLLLRGQIDWATFNRDRIKTALAVATTGPVIALPTVQRDPIEEVPQVQLDHVADLPIGTIFLVFILTSFNIQTNYQLTNNIYLFF